MSLVVAVKCPDKVEFGADTLISQGNYISNALKCKSNYKVLTLCGKFLLASTGLVANKHAWIANRELFDKLPQEGLTKEFLVTEILPKVRAYMQEYQLLNEDGNYDGSFLIAYDKDLFYIEGTFAVYKIEDYVAIGSGRMYADIIMRNENLSIKKRILESIDVAQKDNCSIGFPALFIDTKDMKYKIVRGK